MSKGDHLGDLEELVLLAVLRLGPDADGASVRRELEDAASRVVSVSTVYVTLTRLEEKGFAESRMGDPTPERGGKARRLYAVTAEGFERVEAVREVRARMWDGVDGGRAHA
jgi:PadR family transcriptional regulator PadR